MECSLVELPRVSPEERLPPARNFAGHALCSILLVLLEGRVEGPTAGGEILRFHELAGLAGAKFALHAAVFPFDRERSLVVNLVECPDDLLKIDRASPRAAEVPAAARIAEVDVAGQNSRAAVKRDDRVLDVHVVDAVGERPDELDRIDPLPMEVAGVEVEAEFLAMAKRFKGPLRRVDVKRNLGRMDLQGELHAALGKHVEDRVEPVGKQLKA